MEYFKIQKTVNKYRFEPDYVNFEKVNPNGLLIPNERLQKLKNEFKRKFNYDLIVYRDNDQRFGFLSMGHYNKMHTECPLIKEFDLETIDSFSIKSLHPTRGGGHLEVKVIFKSGEQRELFYPFIKNIGYEIWDWCVDRYIIKPMNNISKLTGIRISEIIKEYDY